MTVESPHVQPDEWFWPQHEEPKDGQYEEEKTVDPGKIANEPLNQPQLPSTHR